MPPLPRLGKKFDAPEKMKQLNHNKIYQASFDKTLMRLFKKCVIDVESRRFAMRHIVQLRVPIQYMQLHSPVKMLTPI